MSKYTADEVERVAKAARKDGWGNWPDMLDELAHRIRQEEEENRRDPVTDPRPGDRIEWADGSVIAWSGFVGLWAITERQVWEAACKTDGATIIRRREVQQ